MQNKQQIDLIKLPKFKIQKFPPRFQSGKTNKYQEENIARIFQERKLSAAEIPLVRRHIKRLTFAPWCAANLGISQTDAGISLEIPAYHASPHPI